MKMKTLLPAALLLATVLGTTSARAGTEITLFRFFGGCTDEYAQVTDLSKAVGECGIIQVLTNKFNAENKEGITVKTQSVEWGVYYDRLSANVAGRTPPDIAVMHRSVLPNYQLRNLLQPLGKDFAAVGIDAADFLPVARNAVTANGELWALPFDVHALLWHVNADLFIRAGLVDAQGQPKLPTSPAELLQHAETMKAKTGKPYFAIPSGADPMPAWQYLTWLWQQGGNIVDAERKAQLESKESKEALRLLDALYAAGHANRKHDYAGAQQAFLAGEAAVLVNGTWGVDTYAAQAKEPNVALKKYVVRDMPRLYAREAVWSDSHMWVLPKQSKPDAAKQKAALSFLKFLNDNNFQWARTGHLPVRASVLQSAEMRALPHRSEYTHTATIATAMPPIEYQRAHMDLLVNELNSTWLVNKDPNQALSDAQRTASSILRRSRHR
ncbi:multiple sugar transport system substrate-binding protein [Archangium gephyra]|uniref:Multiple sugar transport system substrate-binding protein n=1 Tax=Archangium gephyra TaxID=48 RepID=A0AAC8QFE6_9BACT|nr:extracellular solute-binding protein [Archangium gephyra]AKJ06140.1 N-Acetyl-D-glucosamine ABC transport system, sugar-binding protein [Archangium gephyra]REG27107.1 multiple sugar transport system substrate-binding protein [Archangium gephyra]